MPDVTAHLISTGHGVWLGCSRPPPVPAGESCPRLTARAHLTAEDPGAAARALAATAGHVGTASPAGRK